MQLRVARHTNDLEKITAFYIDILGLELLGSFKNHINYDGIFIGKPHLNWHLEFTKSDDKAQHSFDEDDLLVLYPETELAYNHLIKNILNHNISFIDSKNSYWKANGKMLLDPDGYRIVISAFRVTPVLE